MFKKILIGLAAVLVILAIVISLQPSDFRVSRSAAVSAPPETVFARVNELRAWEAWSPWAKIDPAMKQSYEGPAAGPGAISRWSGNNEVGEGSMTVVESKPAELVRLRLEFVKPMPGVSDVEFTFKPQGKQTLVTWTMAGKNNFMGKAFGLFMNMDRMLGTQFEQGLAALASVSESAAATQP